MKKKIYFLILFSIFNAVAFSQKLISCKEYSIDEVKIILPKLKLYATVPVGKDYIDFYEDKKIDGNERNYEKLICVRKNKDVVYAFGCLFDRIDSHFSNTRDGCCFVVKEYPKSGRYFFYMKTDGTYGIILSSINPMIMSSIVAENVIIFSDDYAAITVLDIKTGKQKKFDAPDFEIYGAPMLYEGFESGYLACFESGGKWYKVTENGIFLINVDDNISIMKNEFYKYVVE